MSVIINDAAQEVLRRVQLEAEITARYPDTDRADGATSRRPTCNDCGEAITCCTGCHSNRCPGPECGECGEREDDCTCNSDED